MELLSENVRSNAPSARVCRLVWGSEGDPLKTLGLTREPDVVLASDVVYGNDPKKWRALVATMRALCGAHTLVVVGNVQRPRAPPDGECAVLAREHARVFRPAGGSSDEPAPRSTAGWRRDCAVHVLRRRRRYGQRARRRGGESENSSDASGRSKEKKEKKEKKEEAEGVARREGSSEMIDRPR